MRPLKGVSFPTTNAHAFIAIHCMPSSHCLDHPPSPDHHIWRSHMHMKTHTRCTSQGWLPVARGDSHLAGLVSHSHSSACRRVHPKPAAAPHKAVQAPTALQHHGSAAHQWSAQTRCVCVCWRVLCTAVVLSYLYTTEEADHLQGCDCGGCVSRFNFSSVPVPLYPCPQTKQPLPPPPHTHTPLLNCSPSPVLCPCAQHSLHVGTMTLLLGPGGSGRSTLLKALSGQLQQSRMVQIEGQQDIRYNGQTTDKFVVQRTAAYVDQVCVWGCVGVSCVGGKGALGGLGGASCEAGCKAATTAKQNLLAGGV